MLQRCKILGRTISFTLRYIEIWKHFFIISFPQCASKSFCMYMCYHILHIVWKWLAGTRGGGEDVQQPKNPGPKPIKLAYTSYSRSRNSPACSLHIYWYSVRLPSLLPFYKICMIFQLSSACSTHQAEQNKHFLPFFGVKLTMPPSSGYSTHPAQLTTYVT